MSARPQAPPQVGTARPWRAVAYWELAPGYRHVIRRTAAKTEEGLAAFRRRAHADGYKVDWWEVLPEPSIAAAAKASALR